jgi:hypothetical protein
MNKVVVVVILFLWVSVGRCADLESQKAALDVIAGFAGKLCNNIPLEGSGEDIELSGSARAELNSLVKKIADIGIEGAGKYKALQYQGVLQRDLAKILSDNKDCKLEVWRDLKVKLLLSTSPEVVSPSQDHTTSPTKEAVPLTSPTSTQFACPTREHTSTSVSTGALANATFSDGLAECSESVLKTYHPNTQWIHQSVSSDGCGVSRYDANKLWLAAYPGTVVKLNGNAIGKYTASANKHGYVFDYQIHAGDKICVTVHGGA